MKDIEIVIAKTVGARILCSISSRVAVSKSNQAYHCLDRFSSLLAMFNKCVIFELHERSGA